MRMSEGAAARGIGTCRAIQEPPLRQTPVKKIVYFAHDLSNGNVHRLVRMLVAGGAKVTPTGFRRSASPVNAVEGIPAIDLGRTDDRRLVRRAVTVGRAMAKLGDLADELRDADVILARNLEMLFLAARARRRYAPYTKLAYECIDIHRLQLSAGPLGFALRRLESWLWRDVSLLLTSSPAFTEHYFAPRCCPAAIRLVENKVLLDDGHMPPAPPNPSPGRPWRIGWFGMIRCRRSLEILSSLVRHANGAVEVVIRGRPSAAIFPDFETIVGRLPHIRFGGPYSPDELSTMYGEVHFSWAIDYYERGQNSAWLLPNRIYEGTLHGAVPIALTGVETGRWLARHDVGVALDEPVERSLVEFFRGLDDRSYAKLAEKARAIPRHDLAFDRADCCGLVEALCDN
jgi:hypothetical protein